LSIILLLVLTVAAVVASAVLVIRWALSRGRPQAGFPMDDAAANPPSTDEPRR
jgi:hypothetical protein